MGSYFRDYYSPKASERPTVGDTKFSVVNMDHMGWLNCDGRALSVGTYNILFQAIGYTFGGSSNTFNLPNAKGRVPGAIGQSVDDVGRTGAMRRLGDLSGEEVHLLNINEMPSHTHGSSNVSGNTNGNGFTTSNGNHFHTGTTDGNGFATGTQNVNENLPQNATVANDGGQHTHTFTTSNAGIHNHQIFNTGGSNVHNNMQPTIFIGNMFIYSGKQSYTAGSYPYTSAYPAAIGNILL